MTARQNMDIVELLRLTVERGASDLHLTVPSPPVLRIDGVLTPLEELPGVTPGFSKESLERVTSETLRARLYKDRELDFSYSISGLARFRVNASFQRGTICLAFRRIPLVMPTIDELELPSICKTLALKRKGLVLVTGPTGVGKSTTLAAMLNHLNRSERRHVITIEDPIEFLHQNEKCLIAQRELGDDTKTFAVGLRQALRQDPDVILVGEMRDLDTIATAITAAETGHLVLSSLHTPDASQTVDRMVDVFPTGQQEQIRFQLSLVLEGVLSQVLLPRARGGGRIAAFEVMLGTHAIRRLIRERRTDQIPTYLQTGTKHGMHTMDQHLERLARSGKVTAEEASRRASRAEAFSPSRS